MRSVRSRRSVRPSAARATYTAVAGSARCSSSSPATTTSKVVLERQALLDVGPDGLDPEPLRRALERVAVDVDADDVVAGRVVLRQGTRPAAEVEHAAPGAADE